MKNYIVSFGMLFDATVHDMEALSGTLLTARKHKVVTYQGDLLLQGAHNNVEIMLLKVCLTRWYPRVS